MAEYTHASVPDGGDSITLAPGTDDTGSALNVPDRPIISFIEGVVTYDLERQMEGATKVKTSEFGEAIVRHMGG